MIEIKRIYEAADEMNGKRILIDRLWPRGISKEKAKLDEWVKGIAPSTELRTWFGHDPEKFEEFKRKYLEELRQPDHMEDINMIIQLAKSNKVTLIYGAKDEKYNQAVVLQEYLNERMKKGATF